MITKRNLLFFICITTLHMANSLGAVACQDVFNEYGRTAAKYFDVRAEIATPESIPAIQKMIRSLNGFIRVATQGKDSRSQMYAAALPELRKAVQWGQEIVANGAKNQEEIFSFAERFSNIVQLPNRVADAAGDVAGGFDSVDHYTEAKFQERMAELNGRFKNPFQVLVKNAVSHLEEKPNLSLTSPFPMVSIGNDVIPSRTFPFQYKYIFDAGLSSLFDLFKDRESGVVHAGISLKGHASYDGQDGYARAFLKHDLVHAFVQKHYDQLLFDKFGIKTLDGANRLKQRTNNLLQNRIHEYRQITDPDLRDAIEILFFAILHEQARTYPIGASEDLSTPSVAEFYARIVRGGIEQSVFGHEFDHLQGKEYVIKNAIEWIRTAATEDAENLSHSFPRSATGQR